MSLCYTAALENELPGSAISQQNETIISHTTSQTASYKEKLQNHKGNAGQLIFV